MTSRKFKTIAVDKSCYVSYQRKAQDFYAAMISSEKTELWNAVGLNAVHCAISIADALLVKFCGMRSISDDHMVAVELMKQSIHIDDMNSRLSTLRRILAKKSLIEYDNIIFTKNEAREIMKQAERFYLWARNELAR